MKTRIWIALPLAAALALPVVAQQNSPSSQSSTPAATQTDQSQSSSQTSTTQSADQQTVNGHQKLELQRHEGFWGKINPFARKKYVSRQLSPIKDRVNELDDLTAANAKNLKDVDARAQEGIRTSMAKANEADQHAMDAGNRAQSAQQTAQQASTQVQTVQQVVSNIDQYKPVTEAEIRFRPGQTALSAKAKQALDDMATSLKDQKGYIVQVQAFSSGRGQAAIANSQRMADAVVRYLVINHEVPVYRVHELGLGNIAVKADDGTTRRVTGGRVEISLLKNDLEQLNASATQPQAENQGGVSGAASQSQQPASAQQPSSTNPASPSASPKAPTTKQPANPPIPHM
ncbi:MAG TPA: OmpA family protein [Terriglobales bacterium]|nr:OmpA family protein [Terriglobales bacterium]